MVQLSKLFFKLWNMWFDINWRDHWNSEISWLWNRIEWLKRRLDNPLYDFLKERTQTNQAWPQKEAFLSEFNKLWLSEKKMYLDYVVKNYLSRICWEDLEDFKELIDSMSDINKMEVYSTLLNACNGTNNNYQQWVPQNWVETMGSFPPFSIAAWWDIDWYNITWWNIIPIWNWKYQVRLLWEKRQNQFMTKNTRVEIIIWYNWSNVIQVYDENWRPKERVNIENRSEFIEEWRLHRDNRWYTKRNTERNSFITLPPIKAYWRTINNLTLSLNDR